MIPIERRDVGGECVFCRRKVFMRGSFLVTEETPPEVLFPSECPARPLPGYSSKTWDRHVAEGAEDDQRYKAQSRM